MYTPGDQRALEDAPKLQVIVVVAEQLGVE